MNSFENTRDNATDASHFFASTNDVGNDNFWAVPTPDNGLMDYETTTATQSELPAQIEFVDTSHSVATSTTTLNASMEAQPLESETAMPSVKEPTSFTQNVKASVIESVEPNQCSVLAYEESLRIANQYRSTATRIANEKEELLDQLASQDKELQELRNKVEKQATEILNLQKENQILKDSAPQNIT